VEIFSHHGSEHYCPISQFKIFGISEIELIGGDDDDDDKSDDDDDHLAAAAAATTVGDVNAHPSSNSNNNNVLKFIKDKVGETLEKVVGVFQPKDQVNRI
jgi:hypothetical protein